MEKSKRLKLIITLVLMVLTLTFIWGNSLLSMQKSGEESQSLFAVIEPVGRVIFGKTFTHEFFRKLAHFSEFFLLGLEVNYLYLLLLGEKVQKYFRIIPIGIVVATVDECLQILSKRGAMVRDVLLDCFGYFVATAVFVLISYAVKSIKKNKKTKRV